MADPQMSTHARTASADTSHRHVAQAKAGKESVVWAILHGVGRRWKRVVGCGVVLGAAVGAAVWFFLPPPVPTASAEILIPQKPPTALGAEHPDPPMERQTQVVLVKSRLVISSAIRPPEINNLSILRAQADPLDWLAKNIKVEFVGPEVLRISLSSEEPEQARLIVDAIKDAYLRDIVNRSMTDRGERLKRLNEMAATQEKSLERKRNSIRELAKDAVGGDVEKRLFQQRLVQDQMSATRSQLIRVDSELRMAKYREDFLAADVPIDVTDSFLDRYVDMDKRVELSAGKLKEVETALEANRFVADPKSKFVMDEDAKFETLKKDHLALRARLRTEVGDQVRTQSKSERAAKHQHLKQDNMILDLQSKQLKSELDEYSKTLVDSKATAQDLDPIRFEIKQSEELLGRIRNMSITLTFEQDTPPRVVELEKAIVSKVDAATRKALLAGGGAAAVFLVVGVLIGLLEFRQRRVESPDSVIHGLGIRVFGTVPKPSARPFRWWRSERPEYGVHVQSEAIASARTMLLHGEGLASHRTFLITSPVSSEGKTTLTVQLATSVALSGRRTLLVDGDLRNPNVHERLGLPAGPGLCEILRGEASMFDVIQKTPIPGLLLIQAGRCTAEIGQALVTARLGHLFAIWREEFDFILLDSSPALPVADALILGRHADGVILSLLQGVSRLPQATETCDRFTALGVRVLGAVVNGTPARGYGEKYYGPQPDLTPNSMEAV